MPTERTTKPRKKPGSSSTATRKKKTPVARKTQAKAKKTTASKRPIAKPSQPTVSEQPPKEQPIPGREFIVSATKIAIGTKQKASRLLKVASDFFSNQKKSGKAMFQEIGNSQQVRKVIEFAEVIPKKVKELNQHRKPIK